MADGGYHGWWMAPAVVGETKRRIATESLTPGVSTMLIADRHGISRGQLYKWRRQFLEGMFGGNPSVAKLARVELMADPALASSASVVSVEREGPARSHRLGTIRTCDPAVNSRLQRTITVRDHAV